MAIEGTIVFKKKDLLVSEDFWKKILEARPNVFSFMTTSKTKEPYAEISEDTLDVETVMKIQQDHVANEVFFWLAKGENYPTDDVQPFEVLGSTLLGMAVDCKSFSGSTDHSNEYLLFNQYLIPKLNALGKTYDETLAAISNDIFAMDMRGRGTIVLLGAHDRSVTFSDLVPRQFAWGWSTNDHGFTETKIESSIIDKTKRIIGGVLSSRPIASVEPIKQPPPVEPPKTETATIVPVKTMPQMYTPPRSISNNALKDQYRKNIGYLPGNWKERPTLPIPENFLPRIIKDFKDIPKELYPPDTGTLVTDATLPIIPPKIIEAMQVDFKDLDKHSRTIPPPDKMLEDMNKFPTFWEQFGIEKKITDAWDDTALKGLSEKYAAHMWVLLKNYRDLQLLSDATSREDSEAAEAAQAAEHVDTSGSGVVADPKPTPKWKEAIERKKRAAM